MSAPRALEAPLPPARAEARLPRAVIAAYGLPAFAISAPTFLVQFYFLNFATDVLLLAPAVVGAVLAAGRLWDAVSDPMAGYWSDRTRSARGRRRPWMLAAAPACALSFLAVWAVPRGLEGAAAAAWVGATLLLFTTAATAWGIPHKALGAELSGDGHVRARVFGTRYVAGLLGVIASFGGMQLVATADDPRRAAAWLAAAAACVMVPILCVPPLALRERRDRLGRGPSRPFAALRDVLQGGSARRLLFVYFVDQVAMASQGAVAPYMALYVLERPDLIGVMPAFYIGPLILSVPLWIRLSRAFGPRRVWLVSMLGAAVAYASLFTLQADHLWRAGAILGLAGFWTGCGGPIGPALLAAVVDADEQRTGERKEGTYFAVWAFLEKTASAFVVLVVGLVLQLSGFEPGGEQSRAADFALRACLALLPAVMLAIGAAVFRGFRLDDAPPPATR